MSGQRINLIVLSGGIFLIMMPITAVVPLLYELTAGRYPGLIDWQQHAFISINLAGALFAAVTMGPWSDRIGHRKRLLVPALLACSLTLLAQYWPWPWAVQLTLRLLEGYSHMAALLLMMTLAADGSRGPRDGRAMGAVGACLSLGVAMGTVVGGRFDPAAAETVFLFAASVLAVVAVLAAWLIRDAGAPRAHYRLADILALTARHRELLVPYAFTFIDRVTVGFIISTVSLYFSQQLGLPPATIGLVMAAFLLPYGILTFPVGILTERVDAGVLMVIGSLLYGVFLAVLGLVDADRVVMVMVAGGLVASLLLAPSLILVVRLAVPSQRATAMGGFHLAGSLGFMLGPIVGVGSANLLIALGQSPWPGVFFIIGSLEILCALLLLPVILRIRRLAPARNREGAKRPNQG
ncbi:MAG: MFS transporter [Wenzhouxiangella sp.]